MREFFNVKPRELILFSVFGLIYIIFQFVWTIFIADDPSILEPSTAQRISKLALIGMLTLIATLYAIVSMWLAWRNNEQGDQPAGLFMVKQGLAMTLYICIGQILSVASPYWRSPTQGIPVMYTLCLGGFIGIVVAGIGADMLWKNRRATFLAQSAKRR